MAAGHRVAGLPVSRITSLAMRNSRATTVHLASSHHFYRLPRRDKAPVDVIDRLAPARARAEQRARASKTPPDANSSVCSTVNMSSACRPRGPEPDGRS